MHYVVLSEHSAEICPTSNARTREILMKSAPEIPKVAQRHGVKILAGPLVSHEHVSTAVVETDRVENLHQFILESGLAQWNKVRIIPSQTLEEGMKEVNALKPIF